MVGDPKYYQAIETYIYKRKHQQLQKKKDITEVKVPEPSIMPISRAPVSSFRVPVLLSFHHVITVNIVSQTLLLIGSVPNGFCQYGALSYLTYKVKEPDWTSMLQSGPNPKIERHKAHCRKNHIAKPATQLGLEWAKTEIWHW